MTNHPKYYCIIFNSAQSKCHVKRQTKTYLFYQHIYADTLTPLAGLPD